MNWEKTILIIIGAILMIASGLLACISNDPVLIMKGAFNACVGCALFILGFKM